LIILKVLSAPKSNEEASNAVVEANTAEEEAVLFKAPTTLAYTLFNKIIMDQSASKHPNLTSSNPYEILGLHPTATAQQIKVSYRKLALRHHPDKLSPHASKQEREEAHESFTKIGHAFEILGDENRRREFDAQQQKRESGRGASSFSRHDSFFSARHSPLVDEHFDFMDPFDLFNRFFSHERNSTSHRGGNNNGQSSSNRFKSSFFDDDPFFNSDPFFSGFGRSSMSRHFDRMNQEMNSIMQSHHRMFDNSMFGEGNSTHFTSSSSLGRRGGNGQSVSTCTRTTIVNGVRTTVTERTVVHPDGRVERHVEQQQQQQQREALPSSSSSRRAIGYEERRSRRR
jgi:curved DNA-binding protein CbpA